jgi:hypothetical protein
MLTDAAKRMMKELKEDYNAELKYSTTSEQFVVHGNVEVKEGSMLRGICEHRDDPEDAIFAFYGEILKAKSLGTLRVSDSIVEVKPKPEITTHTIHCSMGSSNDWKQLGVTETELNFLNDIGYKGSGRMGINMEDYLNKIHSGRYHYTINRSGGNATEFTDVYTVTRLKL